MVDSNAVQATRDVLFGREDFGNNTPVELAAEIRRRSEPQAQPQPIRQARRVVPLTLPAPYDGYRVEAWVNYPRALLKALTSGVESQIEGALAQIIQAHDLTDFDGTPLPPATDPAFYEAVSDDLLVTILRAVQEQVGKLTPTSGSR